MRGAIANGRLKTNASFVGAKASVTSWLKHNIDNAVPLLKMATLFLDRA
jgi:hypothetical protein